MVNKRLKNQSIKDDLVKHDAEVTRLVGVITTKKALNCSEISVSDWAQPADKCVIRSAQRSCDSCWCFRRPPSISAVHYDISNNGHNNRNNSGNDIIARLMPWACGNAPRGAKRIPQENHPKANAEVGGMQNNSFPGRPQLFFECQALVCTEGHSQSWRRRSQRVLRYSPCSIRTPVILRPQNINFWGTTMPIHKYGTTSNTVMLVHDIPLFRRYSGVTANQIKHHPAR